MEEITNDPDIFKKVKCGICKKRVSTKLCDFVIDYRQPAFFRSYEDFTEQQLHGTCDYPMCDKCSKEYNRIYDFCPYHTEMIGQIKPTEDMRKAIAEYHMDQLNLFNVQEVEND